MTLYYEDTDMTPYCTMRSAVARDAGGDTLDSLEIVVDGADTWERWKPQPDERIELKEGTVGTGKLYITQVYPERGSMRLTAVGVKAAGRTRRYQSWENATIQQLMDLAAGECGMKSELYGVDGSIRYPWVERQNESMLNMLCRILGREGAKLKVNGGKIRAIGVDWAESRVAALTIPVYYDTEGIYHRTRCGGKAGSLTVKGTGEATAYDSDSAQGIDIRYTGLPAHDNVCAGRWARNLLKDYNRQAEALEMDIGLNLAFTGMERIDVQGDTEASGKWMVDTAIHDFFNRRSSVRMVRVIDTIR